MGLKVRLRNRQLHRPGPDVAQRRFDGLGLIMIRWLCFSRHVEEREEKSVESSGNETSTGNGELDRLAQLSLQV